MEILNPTGGNIGKDRSPTGKPSSALPVKARESPTIHGYGYLKNVTHALATMVM